MNSISNLLGQRLMPVIVLAVLTFAAARAQADEVLTLDIPAQDAGSALLTLAKSSNLQIMLPDGAGANVKVKGLKGKYRLEEALATLLADTGLEYKFASENVVVVQGVEPEAEGEDAKDNEEETESPTDTPLELQPQKVTGTRLQKSLVEISSQVIVFSNEDLRNTGAPTLEQALRQLPQNINGATEFGGSRLYSTSDKSGQLGGSSNINGSSTINLRGLGESASLVLINGKRPGDSGMIGGFTDISEFPISMIDRVEIQLDGASAIYGSDAIAGVINIILKEDLNLVRAKLRRTARTKGGLTEDNGSITAGTGWDTGQILFNWDGYKASHQNVSTTDLLGLNVSTHGYPGNIRGNSGSAFRPEEISSALTQAAIASGAIGPDEVVSRVQIPTGQDGTSLTINDFLASANTFGTNEGQHGEISVSPKSDRNTLRVAVEQEITDWLDVSAGITYAGRRTASNSGTVNEVTFNVVAENPYNPFGTDVRVDRVLSDFGPRIVRGQRDSWTMDLDFSGVLGNQWEWELVSRGARRKSTAETENFVNTRLLPPLVGDSHTDPSNALNVFGDSFLTDGNNASLIEEAGVVRPLQESVTENELLSSELIVRGSLFSLPAGAIRTVVGGEWRKSTMNVDYDNTYARVITIASPIGGSALESGFSEEGTRTTRALFAELLVPIFSEDNATLGVRDLNLSISGRHEGGNGSSSSGPEANTRYRSNVWSAGLVYRPIKAVTLRVNKSTSYRAPNVSQALLSPVVTSGPLFDFRGGGFSFSSIEKITGGNPNLEPETASSITAGILINPLLVEGLSLNVNYHDTFFRDRIAALNLAGGFFLFDFNYEEFNFQYTLDEDGNVTTHDSRPVNIAYLDTRGWDYRINYRFAFGSNSFRLFGTVTSTKAYFEEINPFDMQEPREFVGTRIPKYRYRAGVSWERDGWRLALNARDSSGVRYDFLASQSLEPEQFDLETIRVKTNPPTIVDLRGTLDIDVLWTGAPGFFQKTQVAFGLNNIFNSYSKSKLTPEPKGGHLGRTRNAVNARGQLYYLEFSKEL